MNNYQELTVEFIKYIELKRVPYALKDLGIQAVAHIGMNNLKGDNEAAKKYAEEAKYWLDIIVELSGVNDNTDHVYTLLEQATKSL